MPQPYPICKRCRGLYEQDLDPERLGLCPDCRIMKDTAELNSQKLDRIIELLERLVKQLQPIDITPKSQPLPSGYERVYSYKGPDGSAVVYPSDELHIRKVEP